MLKYIKYAGLICVLVMLKNAPAQAQINPDTTLGPESSRVVPGMPVNDQPTSSIIGGALRGQNLFHSFEQFNVLEGQAVFFISDDGVSRIISRVTGNESSDIFGTLGVLGASDLVFINERGIRFGPEAALALEGSFIGSTASAVQFADGSVFSSDASPPQGTLLTSSIPLGLGFNGNSPITVQDSGRSIIGSFFRPFGEIAIGPGLSVYPSQTLALIGGSLNLEGAIIRTPDAQVELSSVSEGTVSIAQGSTWTFEYDDVIKFGPLVLSQLSLIDGSGTVGGQIRLRGDNVVSRDGSVVLTRNVGGPSQGSIEVLANSIEIGDSALQEPVLTSFITQNLGAGEGASIKFVSRELDLQNGGTISTNTFTSGSSGNIDVDVSDSVQVIGSNSLEEVFFSGINTITSGQGNAGGLTISTEDLAVQDGGQVFSLTVGDASEAGTVAIEADNVVVQRGLPTLLIPSLIGSSSTGFGNSNELIIRANTIQVLDGGAISTSTIGSGNAGSLDIQAQDYIEVGGISPDYPNSSVIASNATYVNPLIFYLLSQTGAPISETFPEFLAPLSGDAGNISIATPDLTVQDGGFITVQSSGSGIAGGISINSESAQLLSDSRIEASTNSGEGGNISFNSRSLLVNESAITSAALGNGSGGNIVIDSPVVALIDSSQISADAQIGRGGQVSIISTGLFQDSSSTISAASAAGPQFDGTVTIQAPESGLDAATPDSPSFQAPQTRSVCSNQVASGRNEFVVAGRGGLPLSPNSLPSSYSGWQENEPGEAGSSTPTGPSATIVEAQGFSFHPDGSVSLVAVPDDFSPLDARLQAQGCIAAEHNS